MRVLIQDVKAGMITAEDISTPRGDILVKKGQTINNEMIAVLKRLGIRAILVVTNKPVQNNTVTRQQIVAVPPELKVQISPNLLSAALSIEPKSINSTEITEDDILRFLQENGIVYGINREAISATIAKWKQRKQVYKINPVAQGIAPEAGHEKSFVMKVSHISNPVYLEKVKNSRYYWEIEKIIPDIQKVNPGDVIAEQNEGSAPIAGINVKGEPVKTDEVIKANIQIGDGVHFSDNNQVLIAAKQGIAYFCNGKIGIQFINFNGSVDLIINHDKSAARLVIHKAAEGGSMPSESEIRSMLAKNGVVYGIEESQLKELIGNFSRQIYPLEPVLIAKSLPARDGEDGWFELLFDTETSLKPQINSDGSVDYKNVKIVHTVEKGQKLARLHPPQKGTPGKNIAGQQISCLDGKPAVLPIGPNTERAPDDENCLIATTNGIVKFTGAAIEVSEGMLIPGDVNFSTGNINYEKTVIINGDVKSGFDITCGGDCQIGGTAEDCQLKIGGNFLCRLGFIGQGRGVLDANGDVNLSFTKNQVIKSRQSVNIAKEAINSTIYAKKSITVHGKPLSVAGGNLIATEGITLYSVGNHSGIRTILEVGVDFTLIEELGKTELQLIELRTNYTKLIESQKKYEKMLHISKQLSIKEQFLYSKVNESIVNFKGQMDALESHKAVLNRKMYHLDDAFIKIEHSAMPGTLFKFGERHYLVKEEIIGPKTVRLIDHEIKVF